ncbi:MAG: phosphopantothenoylcysteine decarboxylase [Planctomycetes bacterium]|nr:phosphopantothenoylcysteine decarboxylase [Planctomycetota bacterium]
MAGHEIILGVSGGIAAFKSAALASQLVQAGHGVSVVMTPAAEQFIGAATFAAITARPVASRVFDPAYPLGAHIELSQRGQLLCIAPATADFLARTALGMADDLLATLYLGFTGPVFMAPAMNCQMWEKPSVQRNVAQLRADGVSIIDPEEGWLSCRTRGAGRMAAPESIAAIILEALGPWPAS